MKTIPSTIIAISVSLFLAACNDNSSGVSNRDVSSFADRSALVIPPTATATDFRSPFSRDGVMMLKLEMPAGEFATFLSKSALDGELTNATREVGFTKPNLPFNAPTNY